MTNPGTLPSPERIDPDRFTLLLEEAGWKLVGARRGQYKRFAPPGLNDPSGFRGSLIIPLDRGAPEFPQMMSAAVREVSNTDAGDLWRRVIQPRIIVDTADQFQFRKETDAPPGTIPWKQGEELFGAARLALVAGAKSYVERLRRYSNRFGQFSNRFLDSILMGQTGVGSYIVTAYAPTDAAIPITSGSSTSGRIAQGRDITLHFASALEATAEAVEHYRSTSSLSGFDAGVGRGVSFELSSALESLARDGDGGNITITWDSGADLFGEIADSHFVFTREDGQALARAATHLAAESEPTVRQTVIGRVHLLTKKHLGGPGVFGLDSISGAVRKVRVRLRDAENYHRAVNAHDGDLILAVSGELERDGNMYWLLNAEILSEVAHVDELGERLSSASQLTDQAFTEELFGESS
ncbi:hypothetical protein [Micromonospora sp. 4G55]|uniref:hypothetical protein n=1 Tax=Micromonospora sp. 4G55 TaxID=2806102 RepID=UPI001A434903|nr:hypothetical protein [Micromonospora sp. 4G55]MBM0255513.1 hypothetical protein [Micromonospora sp. 4G55]